MHPDMLHKYSQIRSREIEAEWQRIHLARSMGRHQDHLLVRFFNWIQKILANGRQAKKSGPESMINPGISGAWQYIKTSRKF